jgi:hypothetical protein
LVILLGLDKGEEDLTLVSIKHNYRTSGGYRMF